MKRGEIWQVEQTVPKDRFQKYIGALDESDMKLINQKIIFALDLIEPA